MQENDVVEITLDCPYQGQEGRVLSATGAFSVTEEDLGSEVLVLLRDDIRAFDRDHMQTIDAEQPGFREGS